jgi:diguanylate cyclase (GGDEF)-like protein
MAFMQKAKVGVPDSRYAEELGKGTNDMTFSPELEGEYRRFFLSERRSQVRAFQALLTALAVWALLASFASTPQHDTLQHLRLGVLALAFATITWSAFSRRYQESYLYIARYATLVVAVFGAFEIAHRVALGAAETASILTAYSIGLYFISGIMLRPALQTNALLLLCFVVALRLGGQSAVQILHVAGPLTLTVLIGALAGVQQAARYRKSFLERGVITDLAARDGLTGLKNRRAFDEHLIRVWQQALRDRKSLAVMFIDVDTFKKFNDRYGHKAGDTALQRIAGVVHGVAKRALDLAARYGGEELAVVLYDVPSEHAAQLAEAMRVAVMNLGIEHLDGMPLEVVTISIGVGMVRPTLARSPDGAVQLADEALYAAKRNGRNRVEIFETEYDALSTGSFRTR